MDQDDDRPLKGFVRSGTGVLGIPLDPDWEIGVEANLQVILRQAAVLLDPPQADECDPAALFRA